MCIFAEKYLAMKMKKYTIDDVYFKRMEKEFQDNSVFKKESSFIYFASYYINVFLHTDLNIKSYIGLTKEGQKADFFMVIIPFDAIQRNKDTKKFFKKYFEIGIKSNDRYVGLMKTPDYIGFIFRHDDELLHAYKTGNYSKISDLKKNKMKKMRVIDYDTKVGAFYVVVNENNEETDEWKHYPLGKKDILMYELYKMIHPDYFYPVMAQQFNVSKEYLKKNQVQILPKPDIEKEYYEVTGKEEFYWFDNKK